LQQRNFTGLFCYFCISKWNKVTVRSLSQVWKFICITQNCTIVQALPKKHTLFCRICSILRKILIAHMLWNQVPSLYIMLECEKIVQPDLILVFLNSLICICHWNCSSFSFSLCDSRTLLLLKATSTKLSGVSPQYNWHLTRIWCIVTGVSGLF